MGNQPMHGPIVSNQRKTDVFQTTYRFFTMEIRGGRRRVWRSVLGKKLAL